VTKVELFECIRRDYHIHGKSKRQIARERGIHRRMVRQALNSAIPPPRQSVERARTVLTDALRSVVDRWLKADREAPRKQRHTARQIFNRLQSEHDYSGAESTVRSYVGERRRELGLGREVHVVQCHQPGEEAEVDWYEAVVDMGGEERKVQIFQMRACCSGREFHLAFPRQTQQAFLEGFVAAFEYFGGVFHTVRLDNLKSAAKKILHGRRREETAKLIALRSHYLFATEFCRPGKEGAHEKGGVEGGGGRFRRTHLVPVPRVSSFAELNDYLLSCCAKDETRRMEGRAQTIAESWEREVDQLLPLPAERFDTAEVHQPRVDDKARVRSHQNWYSVPVRLAMRRVEIRVHANRVEIFHGGVRVAEHERLHGRFEQRLELDHALYGTTPTFLTS